MEYDAFVDKWYNGLNWYELSHDDRCRLIFMIEAAAYCELHKVKSMRRALHKEYCDQRLRKVTASEKAGKRDSFGGTYGSIIDNREFKAYFGVTKPKEINGKKKRNTRIIPHIPQIKELVESKKSTYDYKSEMRVLRPGDKVEKAPKYIFEPRVKISDSLTRSKGVTRELPTESVSISDRLGMVVTHANPKGLTKPSKRVSSV